MNSRKYFLAGLTAGLLLFIASLWLVSDRTAALPEAVAQNVANPLQGDFSQWLERYESSKSPSESVLQEGTELAKRRMSKIRRLIMEDPASALEKAITRAQWESLPDEIKTYVEEPIRTFADVYVSIVCTENSSRIDTFTKLRDGSGFMTYTAPGNRYNRTRMDVEIEGIRLGKIGALANFIETKGPVSLLNIEAATTRSWNMYVILVDFSDWDGWFINNEVVENDINTTVSQQVAEMSFNQLSVNCTVHPGVFRMPQTIDYYKQQYSDLTPMMDAIHADVTDPQNGIGVDVSSYDTVCIISKSYPSLNFGGYANISGPKMWVQIYNPGYTPNGTILHELGHNFGSYHAHHWKVPGNDPIEEEPPGLPHQDTYHVEYGDFTDIMGSGNIPQGHLHVQNKLQVGWLDGTNINEVAASGTFRLYRSDHPETTGLLRGLKIQKAYDGAFGDYHYYWIGYKQLYPEYENFGRGMYVLWQKPNAGSYPKSHLLDMTAGSSGGPLDGGLALGRTYSDYAAGVHITPIARGGCSPNEYMDVVLNLDPSGNNPPTASIDAVGGLTSEESVTVSITAFDPDGDDLAYFWDFGDGLVHPNSPVVHHAFSGTGTTTVRCTVSDMKGGNVTAELVLGLTHPLENWTSLSPVTIADIYDVAYGNGKFVAVGTMGTVAASTDAETWTTSDIGGDDAALVILEAVIFDGAKFIAVGNQPSADYTSFLGVVFTSSDAMTWTRRYLAGTTDIQLRDIAYNGSSTYLVVGDNASYLRSTDGYAWTTFYRLDGSSNILAADHSGIGFIDEAFPVVGIDQSGTTDGPLVAITFSGYSWYTRDAYANAPGGFSKIDICNGFVFASGPYFGINRSTNRGYNFNSVYSGSYLVSSFAYGNGIYLGTGHNASGVDVNLVSADGVNWHELPTALQENRHASFFFNNRFYTLGNNGSLWKSDPVGSAEEGWAKWQRYFSLNLSINRDDMEDQDCDGIENILEYALGTDPGDPTSVPVVMASKDESGHLEITIPRSRKVLDLDYIVEQSTGLGGEAPWTALETEPVSETDTELVVRTKQALTVVSPQFLRLRVDFKASAP